MTAANRKAITTPFDPPNSWPITSRTPLMVGGRSPNVRHEQVCRFEFPERPGALMEFLDTLGGRWNISLFHYRNHGSDFGRVLAGFEVPEGDSPAFESFLNELGYRYQREHDNAAYSLFLG